MSKINGNQIILVIPCYNEEKHFNEEYFAVINSICKNVSLYFIDDGSSDNTRDKLIEFIQHSPRCHILINDINVGKAESIRRGFHNIMSEVQTDFLGFLDGDSQIPIETVINLIRKLSTLRKLDKYDSYWAVRRMNIYSIIGFYGKFRYIVGHIIRVILFFGFSIKSGRDLTANIPRDTQCGFKIYSTSEELLKCLNSAFLTSWFFEWELLVRFMKISERSPLIYREETRFINQRRASNITLKKSFLVIAELMIVKKLQFELLKYFYKIKAKKI